MSETTARDYRSTLNLPKTDFPMRGELPKREPDRVRWWAEHRTYLKRLEKNRAHGGKPFVLHDGPPYANGDLHMGHFLNRVLKDALVKIHLLDGEYADFVPGWDMHGLPIERETLKHLKLDFRQADPLELRRACRERALYWLNRQREVMLRMGVGFGHYDDPYMTIAPQFEATIVETLADLAEHDYLYKGLRSTLWCIYDETALAEAEIEYKDHTSPSIYVRFPATDAQRQALLAKFGLDDDGAPLSVAIWTTTPWTLPANVAIALKPEATYGVYRVGGEDVIVAEALASPVLARFAKGDGVLRAEIDGKALERLAVRHPFLDRDSVLVLADYVELETGTGAVHTAPGHGEDDFETGVRYGMPILNPVDAGGRFTAEAGPYIGLQIFEANDRIVDDLRASGALIAGESYNHSYPHCWRCKNPVVFRATAQWFIGMDRNGLRERSERAVHDVAWMPEWGENRMSQMVGNHPEWCVSRQRVWGTPIPAVVCMSCNESVLDPQLARTFAKAMRARSFDEGNASDLWWTDPIEAFAPPGLACAHCGGTAFAKERNIVDIWFESGVTWRAVLVERGMKFPADAYLEGSDQYRGWFRSNLITSVATRDVAPYEHVISYGWVVDQHGHAMHKSTGNYIGATEGMEKYGADLLRLWVASTDVFVGDVRIGATLLDNVANVYRNLRNRLRWLLGSLDGLTPESIVERKDMQPIDKLALAALDAFALRVIKAYHRFDLHGAFLEIQRFDGEDLSAFYVDVMKEPLYASAPTSHRRRSGQSAIYCILRTMCVLLAPVISFTAEEAWQHIPRELRGTDESVFDLEFPRISDSHDEELLLWAALKALRSTVAAREVNRDFQLRATVGVPQGWLGAFRALGDNLREALVVSVLDDIVENPVPVVSVSVISPDEGQKCARCWKYLLLGSDPQHPTLCSPCAAIVREFEWPWGESEIDAYVSGLAQALCNISPEVATKDLTVALTRNFHGDGGDRPELYALLNTLHEGTASIRDVLNDPQTGPAARRIMPYSAMMPRAKREAILRDTAIASDAGASWSRRWTTPPPPPRFAESLIDSLSGALAEDGLSAFSQFVETSGSSKWLIASDFVVGDASRFNDAFAYTVFPYESSIESIFAGVRAALPRDLKNTKAISADAERFLRSTRRFSFVFLPNRERRLFSDLEDLRRSLDLTVESLIQMRDAVAQREVINAIRALRQSASANSFKATLLQDIFLSALFAGFIAMLLQGEGRASLVGWFPDRDNMTTAYNAVANHVFALNSSAFALRRRYPEARIGFGAPGEGSTPGQALWFDELIRVPDFLAGVAAGTDFSGHRITVVSERYSNVLRNVMADNDNLVLIKVSLPPAEATAQKIVLSKTPFA